jgi:hypothetical protein
MLMVRKMLISYGERLLSPHLTPKLEDHPCMWLFIVYSQLLSIAGGCFLHPQPEDTCAVVIRWMGGQFVADRNNRREDFPETGT